MGQALLRAFQDAGWAPPAVGALLEELQVTAKQAMPLLAALRSDGKLIRVTEDIWYAAEHLGAIEQAVRDWFKEHETLDIAAMKSITDLSRKHMIPLLEYFDAQKITMRTGDVRVLRNKI